MKIQLTKTNLKNALNTIKHSVNSKSTLPVLANVAIVADDNGIAMTATDLETVITCKVNGAILEQGETTTTHADLLKLVNLLPDHIVTIAGDTGRTETVDRNVYPIGELTCDNVKADLSIIPYSEYCLLPEKPAIYNYSLPSAEFADSINKTVFSCAKDFTRPVLTGVDFSFDHTRDLTMVATDGFRLSRNIVTPYWYDDADFLESAIVPLGTLQKIAKILPKDTTVYVTMPAGENNIFFNWDDVTVVSQLVEGIFPDVSPIFPTTHNAKAYTTADDLKKAVKMMQAYNGNKSILTLETAVDGLTVANHEGKNMSVAVESSVKGENIKSAIQANFMSDMLTKIGKCDVQIDFISWSSPIVVYPVGSRMTYIIMPYNIYR